MRYIIDRSEGEYWVLEDSKRNMHSLPKTELPPDCREGDVLQQTDGKFFRDPDETARRKAELAEKQEKLRKRAEKD